MRDDDRDYENLKAQHKATGVEPPPPLEIIDPVQWEGKPVPERQWIVAGIIPAGNVTILGGDGGLGKSILALMLLVACALGKPWLDIPVQQCKGVGIFCEDDVDELHRRLVDILRFYGASFADLTDLTLICRVGQDNVLVTFANDSARGIVTPFYAQIEELIADRKIVVLDSLHDFFAGNENSRTQVRQFVAALRAIAISNLRPAIVITAHPSLSGRNSGTGESGTTGWNNTVRSRLYFTAPHKDNTVNPDRDYRELRTMKANYAAGGGIMRLRWRDGVFVREESVATVGLVATLELDRDLINGLRYLVKNGTRVPADPNAASGFANAIRKLPSCKRYDWATICAAQERLIDQGKLVRVELGPPSKIRVYIRPADMFYAGELKGTK